jgi:hypothetical protein
MQKYIRPPTPPPYMTFGIPITPADKADKACIGYDCSICGQRFRRLDKIVHCTTAYYYYHFQCFVNENKHMCKGCQIKKKS